MMKCYGKIRAGYAAVLYGVFTLVVSLGDKTKWFLSMEKAGLVALTLAPYALQSSSC